MRGEHIFVAAIAHLEREFEFVKTEWLNQGPFIGVPDDQGPLAGPNAKVAISSPFPNGQFAA